ncbi:oxidoreductase, 2OG-Fe(II) oxygenase family [Penicillium brasilianum]|uniref:Oxidoreductase, 2OG-Fe(II) oxygenase family n=1 Tax=Penicillium brasilianum TaxID=104259 RepID=A0A1S9RP21_PENBI|nr:oxidoreductase, 2OG-Fe(II) oxygenase family [Penicillium brasilianum]
MAANSIPTIDYSLSTSPATRPKFLSQLRDALVRVGFFYLQNHPIPECLQEDLLAQSRELFQLSPEKKQEIDMASSKHFIGYVGMEDTVTVAKKDYRESYTLGYESPAPSPDEPIYRNLRGPNLWPDNSDLPEFRPVMERYMTEVRKLADEFKVFVAQALDMKPTALAHLFDGIPFDRLMLAKYSPAASPEQAADKQGVQGKGVHKDASLLTFLLPGTSHGGLQALSPANEWIPVPPVPGAMIINVGIQLEALTDGVCYAALHKVVMRPEHYVDSNGNDLGPRFSFPLFHTISLDAIQKEPLDVPPHILALVRDDEARRNARVSLRRLFQAGSAGYGVFATRLRVYQKVTQRWFPQYLDLLSLDKIPQLGAALHSESKSISAAV